MERTEIKDLVLIHISGKPVTYARIEAIEPDIKPGWWRVKLLLLTYPPQVATWILEREQIDGTPFTMGGTPVRLEKVQLDEEGEMTKEDKGATDDQKGLKRDGDNVISLNSVRKRKRG